MTPSTKNSSYYVLAVEDDSDTLTLVRLVLKDIPLRIVQAATGAEALGLLGHETPALLLLDLSLPDMGGWEVLKRMRSDERMLDVPVIVLTSHNESIHRVIGRLQPVSAFLLKPVNASELQTCVRQALNLS
jgi:CheY-like chemotaxis protein